MIPSLVSPFALKICASFKLNEDYLPVGTHLPSPSIIFGKGINLA
jgi:hypothetical protein